MRYITRLNMLGILAFISILIALSLLYASGNMYTDYPLNLQGTATSNNQASTSEVSKVSEDNNVNEVQALPVLGDVDNRLVVFGDDWSAVGSRLAEQGQAWPEWFSSMWPCRLQSYAQKDHVCESSFCGSVVDESELHSVVTDAARSLEVLPDLRTQIDQWLDDELDAAKSNPEAGGMTARLNSTVFAVSFLIWDIWKFNGVSVEDTSRSIERSLDTLFEQFHRLVKYSEPDDLRILLMMSIDPTILPAFDPPGRHRDMLSIVTEWNLKLEAKANEWTNGSMYVFNTNEFVNNQIRSRQFFLAGMLDGHGLGKQNPWDDVENPCVYNEQSTWLPFIGNKDQRCENPEKFLFWDGLHLGQTANQMMATEIFHDIQQVWVMKPNSTSST